MAVFRLIFLAFVLFQSFSVAVFADATVQYPIEQKTFGQSSTQVIPDGKSDSDYKTVDQITREAIRDANSNSSSSDSSSSSDESGCQYDPKTGLSVSDALNQSSCKPRNVITANGYGIWVDGNTGARDRVVQIANQLIIVGSLLSIGAIVYAGFIYVTALGDDEKIKNGKNSLKWGIIGFVVMLISFPLVNAIIRLVYQVGS